MDNSFPLQFTSQGIKISNENQGLRTKNKNKTALLLLCFHVLRRPELVSVVTDLVVSTVVCLISF